MDFAFIPNRFGQPFRPNFSIDRNRNGADQVTILNHPAPKPGNWRSRSSTISPTVLPVAVVRSLPPVNLRRSEGI